jgi:hypothetical protein
LGPDFLKLADELAEEVIKLARKTNYEPALQYFSTHFQEMLKRKNPSVTILFELIEATQASGNISVIFQYVREEYLEKAQNNQSSVSMLLAAQMIKSAREMSNQPILDYFSQDYIKAVLKSREPIPIELAIEMIKLERETGKQENLDQLIKKCVDIGFTEIEPARRRYATEDNSVALLIELLKAACEIDKQQVPKSLVNYVRFVIARIKYLLPDYAATVLKFVHKINDQKIIEDLGKNYLPDMLQNQVPVPVELAIELIKLALEQKTYHQADIERYYHDHITVEGCHLGTLPLDTIIDIRHLARVFGDGKLAQQIDARLGI